MMQDILGAVATLIGLIGYAVYIKTIIQGNTRPHVFSWFVWGVLTAIAWVAQVSEGAGPGAWVTGMTAGMSFVVVALAFFKSRKNLDITRSDVVTFIGALASIPLWLMTGDPLLAVILVSAIDVLGFYPTFRKGYFKPDEENLFHYNMAALKFVIGILAITSFSWVTVLYPASLVLMNGLFVVMILWRRHTARSIA